MNAPALLALHDGTDRPSVLDSKFICYACAGLIAVYCWLLIGIARSGPVLHVDYTVFGWKELDFGTIWAAGRLASSGHAAAAYDWVAVHDLMIRTLGRTSLEYFNPFYYPPWFLLAVAPFAKLPFWIAAGIWGTVTLAVYLAAIRKILPGGTALVAALATPTVILNLFVGQNGLLAAGLLGSALIMLDAAPIAAGILIGLLAYKPHFGVLLPLILAVTGRWRVFAAAAATVVGQVGIAAAVLGGEVFVVFAQAARIASDAYLLHRHLPGMCSCDLASGYGLLKTIGLGSTAAWGGHIAAASAAAAGSLWLVTSGLRADLKRAGIATAVVIVTPYSELNDLAILTVAIAFIVRDSLSAGIRRGEWAALSAALLTPLIYIAMPYTAGYWGDRLVWLIGPSMCAVLALVIAQRVLADPHGVVPPGKTQIVNPSQGALG